MAKAPSLFTSSTGLCADSVESVPGYHGLFALATYQVDKHEQDQALASSSNSGQASKDEGEDEEQQASRSTSPAYTRRGTCSLYCATSSSEEKGTVVCEKVDMIDTPAILDMKWSLTQDEGRVKRLLGVANAKGQITLHRLQGGEATGKEATLKPIGELQLNDRNALCLSLDWSDRRGSYAGGYDMGNLAKDTSLIVSQSDGSLAYLPSLELAFSSSSCNMEPVEGVAAKMATTSIHKDSADADEDEESDDDWDQTSEDERQANLASAHAALNSSYATKPPGLSTWAAHDFEAWIAGFDCFTPTTVWSGGDDLALKGWDLRTPVSATSMLSATFACTKPFNGGVTTLQSHHLRQHIWAVGSYDSHVRLFDARMPARPLSETHVGAGVWRVKWHPHDPTTLLVACMHDGFKVLKLDQLGQQDVDAAQLRGSQMQVVTRFDEHASLAYGCDWDRGSEDEQPQDGRRVYSCSFYDATMHIWDSLT